MYGCRALFGRGHELLSPFLHHNLSEALSDEYRGGVIAIGNFDGVHRGHQHVLEAAQAMAKKLGVKCFALSFEPHPITIFRPDSPVFRLTPEAMKARVLELTGIDGLLTLPFTLELAATSAGDFVSEFLLNGAGASHIVTGFNFHFGKDRGGSPEFLLKAGKQLGFGVTIVDALGAGTSGKDKVEVISSSRIRDFLTESKPDEAAKLLGYRWCVSGKIVRGAQLGRTLGFPTANINLPENCKLAQGIYAVRLRRADGQLHDGVASYGRRPTFDNGKVVLETFIFDFSQEIYGETVDVSLFSFLRGEEKFDNVEDLIKQMDMDASQSREILSKTVPLSALDNRMSFDQ